MITQRASSWGIVRAKPSRIARSSAPRLSGLEIVRRATKGAGSSIRSRPSEGLLEDNERVALGDRLALRAQDLSDDARILGLDRHLHLHRLQDDDGLALFDRVADLDLDLPHGAGDVGFDVGQLTSVLLSGASRPQRCSARSTRLRTPFSFQVVAVEPAAF